MKHFRAMAIKFVADFILLYVILGLVFEMSMTNVFFISLVLAVASYLVGDIWILPKTNNMKATVADFGLAFVVIWFLSAALTSEGNISLFFISLFSALAVSLVELFFHKYISSSSFRNESDDLGQINTFQYRTEASNEITPEIRKDQENKK